MYLNHTLLTFTNSTTFALLKNVFRNIQNKYNTIIYDKYDNKSCSHFITTIIEMTTEKIFTQRYMNERKYLFGWGTDGILVLTFALIGHEGSITTRSLECQKSVNLPSLVRRIWNSNT